MEYSKIIETLTGAGYEIKEEKIIRKNGIDRHAVLIARPNEDEGGVQIRPTMYVDAFLDGHLTEDDLIEYAKNSILKAIETSGTTSFIAEKMKDREYILKNLQLGVQRKGGYNCLTRTSSLCEDLEDFCFVAVKGNDGNVFTTRMTEEVIKANGISEEEMWEAAEYNTLQDKNCIIMERIEDCIDEETKSKMILLTNRAMCLGTGLMYKKEFFKKEFPGEDEVIIIPMDTDSIGVANFVKGISREYELMCHENIIKENNNLLDTEHILYDKPIVVKL